MKYTSTPFKLLPYSDLFRSYTQQSGSLQSFYQVYPFNDKNVAGQAARFRFRGDRIKSAEALSRFHKQFEASDYTFSRIERLKQPDSLAVVTGQQLSLYGGPLFTVYKTVTAIIYAKRWEMKLKRPVIPVFWLADEDHDYEEAGELGIFDNDRWKHLELKNGRTRLPVGREILDSEFKTFEKDFFDLIPETDFSDSLKKQIKKFYRKGAPFREAFGKWILHLFAKHGLILAGSDDPDIKKLIAEPMLAAAEDHDGLFESLDSQSARFEESGYERQALVQNSNLFFIDPDKGRQKLDIRNEQWMTGNGRKWNLNRIGDEIRRNPENFSPNVFLRPIMQDLLVPTLAYVAGPGELAYYGQMKAAYEWMGQEMPMLIPRFSMTLKEPAIDRISGDLPFEFHEYSKRVEDLESLYLKRTAPHDVEGIFADWSESIDRIVEKKKREIGKIDPTLTGSAEKAGALFKNEMNKLKGKTYRSVKNREKIQMNRIRRVKENLFPDGDLQERKISFVYYMIKYGPDVWDRLLDLLEDEVPDSHKIVYL